MSHRSSGIQESSSCRRESPSTLRFEGFDEDFDPPLEKKYECPICLLGLREPVQTNCGHSFCLACFLYSVREAGLRCPVDNEFVTEQQFNCDNFAKREVLNHPVFCRWKKLYGCLWKGPLSRLEDHLKECDFVEVSCPKNCGEEFERKDLKKHLKDDCPNRTFPCPFCAEDVLWSSMENHFQDCPQYPLSCEKCGKENIPRNEDHLKECDFVEVSCPKNCGEEVQRKDLKKHLKDDCPNRTIPCPFCAEEVLWNNMENHFQDCPRYPLSCEKCGKENIPRNKMQDHNAKECPRAELKCPFSFWGCLFKGTRPAVNEHVKENLLSHMMDLTTEFGALRLKRPETIALEFEGRVCNGSYIWRIDNYRQHRQNAINGIPTALHSPAFYDSLYGYKLCLRINLNGVDSGVGRYIALFVHMMQGDYDSILEWPFTGRITLTILDQSEGTEFRQHISESLIAKPNLLAFQRPTAPLNDKGDGYVEFAPIEHIREPTYIKNNTMLVRIQIDH